MGTITKNYIIIILFEIECNVMCRVNDLLNTFLFNDCTIFAAAEFTVKFSFADCLPTDLRCCSEVSWEITDSSLKLEDPITKTAFLSKSEEAYCMQTEHVIRSISLL
jgi:hypothetical protein